MHPTFSLRKSIACAIVALGASASVLTVPNAATAQPASAADRMRGAAPVAQDVDGETMQPVALLATVPAASDLVFAGDLVVLSDMAGESSPLPAGASVVRGLLSAMLNAVARGAAATDLDLGQLRQAAVGADWQSESVVVTTNADVARLRLEDGAAPVTALGDGRMALRGNLLHFGDGELFDPTITHTSPTFDFATVWAEAATRVPSDSPAVMLLVGGDWVSDLPADVRRPIAALDPRRVALWLERDASVHLMIETGAAATIAAQLGGAQATIAAFLDAVGDQTNDEQDAFVSLIRLAVDGVFSRVSLTVDGSYVAIDLAAPTCGGLSQQWFASSAVAGLAAFAYTEGFGVPGDFAPDPVELAASCDPSVTDATVDTSGLSLVGGGPGWRAMYATADLDALVLRNAATLGGLLPFALDAATVDAALAPLALRDADLDASLYIEEAAGAPGGWVSTVPAALLPLMPAIARHEFTMTGAVAAAGDTELLARNAGPSRPAGWERAMTLASMDSPGAIVLSGSAIQRVWQGLGNFVARSELSDFVADIDAVSLALDVQGHPIAYFVGDFGVDASSLTGSLRTLVVRTAQTMAAFGGMSESSLGLLGTLAEQLSTTITFSQIGDDTLALSLDADGNALVGAVVGLAISTAPFVPRIERQQMAAEASNSLYQIYGSVSNAVYSAASTTSPGVPRPATSGAIPPSVAATPGLPALEAACEDNDGWLTYDPDRWDDASWQTLGFRPPEHHRFVYQFDATTANGQPAFTARAFGDLDCDGVYSTYRISGAIDQGGWLTGGWVESELPGE